MLLSLKLTGIWLRVLITKSCILEHNWIGLKLRIHKIRVSLEQGVVAELIVSIRLLITVKAGCASGTIEIVNILIKRSWLILP